MPRGKYGTTKAAPRKYDEEFIARVKHRYLTHKALGYLERGDITAALAEEFALPRDRITYILQQCGVFK